VHGGNGENIGASGVKNENIPGENMGNDAIVLDCFGLVFFEKYDIPVIDAFIKSAEKIKGYGKISTPNIDGFIQQLTEKRIERVNALGGRVVHMNRISRRGTALLQAAKDDGISMPNIEEMLPKIFSENSGQSLV
jgi:hypothetical protein